MFVFWGFSCGFKIRWKVVGVLLVRFCYSLHLCIHCNSVRYLSFNVDDITLGFVCL